MWNIPRRWLHLYIVLVSLQPCTVLIFMLSILLSGIHYYPQRPLPHTSEHCCIQSVDPHITVHPHCLSSTPLVHRVHAHPPCNPCHLPPLPSLPLWWLSLSSSFCPSSFQCPCAGLSLSDPARGPARVLIVCPIVSILFSHSPSVKYSQRQLTLFIFVAGQLEQPSKTQWALDFCSRMVT